MIGQTISHYEILEKLGSGGMGDVYKAQDTHLKRTVALKFLPSNLTSDKQARQRFINEARAASSLDHPNIGTIYEINEHDGHFFIAMAYYAADTLKDKIQANKAGLKIDEAMDIGVQIARGLSRAHSRDIIHRDIKPANIALTEEGQAKIIDFGLAKLKGYSKITKTGTTMGTIAYMSPEQARGKPADHRSDIWSLGVILYEMLTGQQPFKGEHEQAILYLIINEQPEFISKIRKDIPLRLERIIGKALAKNPDKRYQSMEAMLTDLDNALEEFKEGESKTASIFKLGRKQRKLVYRSLTIFLIFAIAVIYLWQQERAKKEPISIALLPLKNLNNTVEQEWFSDGVTDALITDLAKISGLRVISRTSTMAYKETEKTPPEIASELDIQYLIEGSVLKQNDHIKISARLINAQRNEYLWAEEYDRGFIDILQLQGEIAQSIANQIQIKLTPQEETLLAGLRKIDPKTYEFYLKGMYHINKYTPEGYEKGFFYLHQAAERDPDEPLAHAGLALAYGLYAHAPSPAPDAQEKSRDAALKALELDDSMAEAHLALAMCQIYRDWDKEGAEKSYKRALELNPNMAVGLNQYAWYLLLIGKNKEAEDALKKAEKIDPLDPAYPAWLSSLYNWVGQNDKAIIEANKSLELVENYPIALWILGYVYADKQMFDQSVEIFQTLNKITSDFQSGLGYTYAVAGQKAEALAIAAELENQVTTWNTWGLAEIYTALGDNDKAFYWLEQAFEQRHPYIQWIKRNPSLKPLDNDARFDDLAKRLHLPE